MFTKLEKQLLEHYWDFLGEGRLQSSEWPTEHDLDENTIHPDALIGVKDLSFLDMTVYRGVISSLVQKGVFVDGTDDWDLPDHYGVSQAAWPKFMDVITAMYASFGNSEGCGERNLGY